MCMIDTIDQPTKDVQMKQPTITHIEVIAANKGAEVFGLKDGQLLKVHHVTNCFIFARSFSGQEIKISKQTKRACHWVSQSNSPVFNV